MTGTDAQAGDVRARVAEVRRRMRPYEQARIRAGRAKPRTAREWAIFAADLCPSDASTPESTP